MVENAFKKLGTELILFLPHILLGILIFLGCWIAGKIFFRAARIFASRYASEKSGVILLLGKTAYFFFVVTGIISALGTFGVNVSALIASLGLTGFALGFALKDAISNTLAGILILFYRPFRRGDWISVTALEGEVADIDLRYTTLTSEGHKIIIPNSSIFTNPVIISHRTPVSALKLKE